ncbi:MAG: phenylalanine--tRNA ligase subunit beta [Deltaproteobacteria bacterium]|jgi:phenylalanyl-tRNA synthetase beta chain|nr:phenylalanine--tRNA ligase subunit beta [Deltaproteobacteria bacterium]
MKVSLSWLKEYVNINMNANDLADALTMVGLEVESVSDRYDYLNSVYVGRIVNIDSHPNSDQLKLCSVDIGGDIISVVCGAPNIKRGMIVPCAIPGTRFPKGTLLEKSIIRGKTSEGMLCSELELGLGSNGNEIMALSNNLSVGDSLNKALGLSDPVFEIDLTPNRPDCLSIIGTAREIAAIENKRVVYPEIYLPESINDIVNHTSVTITAPTLCPRYAASLIFDVTVGPSPFWLQDRLISVGLKPINNIVDITNFVMMESGQPLHAFDFDRLDENRIVVRTAQENETFITLDGKERRLDPEMLMICDGKKPVAMAGVMGGLNSEVEDTTTNILLESAYFDPVCIRKTSKKTGLNTDASHRFERGVDPNGTLTALNRATQLIAEIGGGKCVEGVIDEYPLPFSETTIDISIRRLNRHLGTRLDTAAVGKYLTSIEFEVIQIDENKLRVTPPSCRVDIKRFEDISEEIARLFGYNNIETTFPLIPADARHPDKKIDLRDRTKILMTGLGFSEAINYSFISKQSCDRLELPPDDPKRKMVDILNPISEDQSVMRTSLIPGLLETMKLNISLQNKNLKLFEIGNVFFHTGQEDSQPDEVEMLAGLWTGTRVDSAWSSDEINCDFYDLKGVVEELLRKLDIVNTTFTRIPREFCLYTRPGFTARILDKNEPVGLVGEVHPKVLGNYDLQQTAFIFELNFDRLIQSVPDTKSARPIPKYPSTSRDITLIIDNDVETYKIIKTVEILQEKLVEHLHLFDVFMGDPIPKGKKSVSFRITYRSSEETLEDNRVNHIHKTITNQLLKTFDATLPAE